MKGKICVIVLVILIGCTRKEKSREFSIVKTHAINDSNPEGYQGSYVEMASIVNNEMIILDNNVSEILVYDFETFKFKSKFGKKGSGPNELGNSYCAIKSKDNKFYVTDTTIQGIKVFDEKGNYLERISSAAPLRLFNFANDVYLGSYGIYPESYIRQITGKQDTIMTSDFLTSVSKNYKEKLIDYFTDDKDIYFNKQKQDEVYKVNGSEFERVKYESPSMTYSKTMYKPFYKTKYGWVRLYGSWEDSSEDTKVEDLKRDAKLCFYDDSFKLLDVLDITNDEHLKFSLLVESSDDYLVFGNMLEGEIYKYKIIEQ